MKIFKDEVARLSNGAIAVDITAASPRPLEELIDDIHVGRIFATWMSVGYFSRLVPEIAAISLPFVFENYSQANRVVAGPVGAFIAKSSRRRASSFSPGGIWGHYRFRTRNGR